MSNNNEWTPEHTVFFIIHLICLFFCVKITKFIIKRRDKKWLKEVEGKLQYSTYCYMDPSYGKYSNFNSSHYKVNYELTIDGKTIVITYLFNSSLPESVKFYYYKNPKHAITKEYKTIRHKPFKFFMYVIMPFILLSMFGVILNK